MGVVRNLCFGHDGLCLDSPCLGIFNGCLLSVRYARAVWDAPTVVGGYLA